MNACHDLRNACGDAVNRRASTEENAAIVDGGRAKILEYLTSVPAWYLATCEGDQPHVRPFSFAAEHGGRIWFCTATTKDVYRELCANPKFELTAWKPGHGWVIIRGKADLEERVTAGIREEGYRHMTALGEDWDGPDDSRLTYFSMTEAQAWICDIDGSKAVIEL